MVPAGTLVVRTAQPLGTLAVYLLEPRSEDGLAAWNFFDADLKAGGDFPVTAADQVGADLARGCRAACRKMWARRGRSRSIPRASEAAAGRAEASRTPRAGWMASTGWPSRKAG